MSQPRRVTYRAGLFDASYLSTTQNIENALLEFSWVLNQGNHIQALEELFDKDRIVELVLSGLSEEVPLSQWIIEQFPTTPTSYESSFSAKLIGKLSHFFLFHLSAEEDLPEPVSDHYRTAKIAPEILQALFAGAFLEDNAVQADQHRSASSKKFKAKGDQSQREMKLAKKAAARSNALDEKPFIALSLSVPRTRTDAETTAFILLDRLRNILEFYLTRIRTPETVKFIQDSFMPQDRPNLTITTETLPSTDNDPPPLAPMTASETHPLFPLIQPMKSALYFDSPEGFGKWSIRVSQGACKDLRDYHHKSKKSFDIIVKKIKELSLGHFSHDNQKRLNGPTTEVPIFEAKMTGDLRLVYQIDCVTGYDNMSTMQVLRLFGIYTHAKMDNRMWQRVASHLSRRGKQYKARCLERISAPGPRGNVYVPAEYSSDIETDVEDQSSSCIPDLPADDGNQLHRILTLEKYVTLSKELLESIENDREAAFPFEVSKQERTIIEHPSSCYVLGRSGTGKTTTMLFKMLWIERAYQMHSEGITRPRQVFVTKSRVLARKVEEHFMTYLSSLATASHISKNPRASQGRSPVDDDENLQVEGDDAQWRRDLPQQYSQLEDQHFPLFVTFDQLCTMIERDFEAARKHDNIERRLSQKELPSPYGTAKKGKLVTFDRFLGEYWPHFNQSVTRKFHPSLVFNEIMGVILGSEGTIKSAQGYLDRQTYENISHRIQPTFAEHRCVLYDTFLSYLATKQELDDFDVSEKTHSIIRDISEKQITGRRLDYLYVDETQDNLLIDALLLRMLCRNRDGLFWAGDTAQTISAGSSFRFDDLKAFLHRVENKKLPFTAVSSESDKPAKPKTFHLAVNFRSHAGIVNCAHDVVQLISRYFPYTIDALSPERGTANGAKPIFYTKILPGFVHEGHFLARNRQSSDKIELGAHQCILVRDEIAKQRLAKEIGKIGLIMTLYESKGLEFNDVFLYNFFHDSPMNESQWRIVLRGIPEEMAAKAAPEFDSIRHSAICSELKCLYVAITRARNNLRIADESLKGESMRALWASHDRIHSCDPGDDVVDFAVPSSREEWAKRAKELFDNGRYAPARESYEKAHKLRSAAIAHAYYLQEKATRTPSQPGKNKVNPRATAFQLAAKAFSSCARDTNDDKSKKAYHNKSAKCWEEAGDFLVAARTYKLAENFTDASLLFRKLGRFDDVHDIIVKSPNMVQPVVLESLQDVVRLYYVSRKEFGKTHQLFSNLDEEIEYLEDRNLDLAQLDLLLLHGKKLEAAELHLAEGRILEAVDLLLDNNNDKEYCTKKAKDCILEGLWKLMSFGAILSPSKFDEVGKLLSRSRMLDPSMLDQNDQNEIKMFAMIASKEFDKLSQLTESFLRSKNINAAFLCFDHSFARIPSFLTLDIFQMAQSLRGFFDYVRTLHDLAFVVDPSKDRRVWKLFGIKANPDDTTFSIPFGTFIHQHCGRAFVNTTVVPESDIDSELVLSKEKLVEIFQIGLRERLLDRVTRENDGCRKAPALSPCLRHIAFGNCDPSRCTRSHISPDSNWFQHWIKVHLLQILIYHSILPIQFAAERQAQQRFWIKKLYEVLHPPHYSLGSISNLDHETDEAFAVVITWIRSLSFSLDFQPAFRFLTIVLQTAEFAFLFDEKEALTYMSRSNFAISPCPSQYLRGDRQNSLQELLISFNDKDPSCVIRGILFIWHVMESSIPVDIDVFCTLIERVCGLLIVFNRYRWKHSFHSICLPRSWLRTILARFDPATAAAAEDTDRFWLLLQPLRGLLIALYFGQNCRHLLYGEEFRDISTRGLTGTIRGLYIARICRVLGLLGSNISVTKFQVKIWDTVTSLRTCDNYGHLPRLYAGYVNATDFGGILRETRRSMQGSPLDEMVQLLDSKVVKMPIHDILGLCRIVYETQTDILPLLGKLPLRTTISTGPEISLTVETTYPSSSVDLNIKASTKDDKQNDDETDEDLIPNNGPDAAAEQDPDFIPQTAIPVDSYVGHSAADDRAATLIQKVYRKMQERRRMRGKSGLEGAIYRWIAEFQASVKLTMNYIIPQYKVQYLVPIPLLLACLDAIESLVLAKKKELRSRLVHEQIRHEDLDEVGPGLNRANAVIKEIKQHRVALVPAADVHRSRDLAELEKRVRCALDLLVDLRLSIDIPEPITKELSLVYKGILQKNVVPKTPRKKRRPTLAPEESIEALKSEDTASWEDETEESVE